MTDGEPEFTLERPSAFSLWLNGLPFVHAACGLALTFGAFETIGSRVWFLLGWIYLVPPIAARLIILMFGRPTGRQTQDRGAYRVWWVLTQLQTLFNRLPWLEECLRLVPGLYALWIRIWGGNLSPFAYIGPGVLITDRYSVQVERGVVLGLGSVLVGHMVTRDEDGRWVVDIAAPRVEAEAILGGDAWLGPGAVLRAGHLLPTGRRIGPFDEWPRRKVGDTA